MKKVLMISALAAAPLPTPITKETTADPAIRGNSRSPATWIPITSTSSTSPSTDSTPVLAEVPGRSISGRGSSGSDWCRAKPSTHPIKSTRVRPDLRPVCRPGHLGQRIFAQQRARNFYLAGHQPGDYNSALPSIKKPRLASAGAAFQWSDFFGTVG